MPPPRYCRSDLFFYRKIQIIAISDTKVFGVTADFITTKLPIDSL
jgi:hypothetical protein